MTACLLFTYCAIGNAGEGDASHQTIDVPATYPQNWLEKQPHMPPLSAVSIQQNDDGTIVLKNATPTITTIGKLNQPTDVIAFADLGTRSLMLVAEKDSQAYKKPCTQRDYQARRRTSAEIRYRWENKILRACRQGASRLA